MPCSTDSGPTGPSKLLEESLDRVTRIREEITQLKGATAADAAAAKAALPQAGSAVFAEPEPSAQYSLQALAGLPAEATGEQQAPPKTVDSELPWTIAAFGVDEPADAAGQPHAGGAGGSLFSPQATSPATSLTQSLLPSAGKGAEQVSGKTPRRSTFGLSGSDLAAAATRVEATSNNTTNYAALAATLARKKQMAPGDLQPATGPATQQKQPQSPGGRSVSRAGSYTERHAQRQQQWPLPAHEEVQQATSGPTPNLMQWSESKALQKLLRNLEQANAVKQASDARLKKGSAKDSAGDSRQGSRATKAGLARTGRSPGSSYKRVAPRERTQPFVPQPGPGGEKRAANQALLECSPALSGTSSRRVSHFSLAALVAGEPSLAHAVSSPGGVRTGSATQKGSSNRAGGYARSPSAVKTAAAAKAAGGLLAARRSPRSASKGPSMVARVQSWGGVSPCQRQQPITRSATMRRLQHGASAQQRLQQPHMQEQGQPLPVIEVGPRPASRATAAKAGTEPHDTSWPLKPPQAAAGSQTEQASGANEPNDTPLRLVYSRLNSFASSGRASAAGVAASEEAEMQGGSSGGPHAFGPNAVGEQTGDGTAALSSSVPIASAAGVQHPQQQQRPAQPPAEALPPPLQQQDPLPELTPRPNQPASPSKFLRWWGKVSPFARLQSPPKTPLEAHHPAAVPAREQDEVAAASPMLPLPMSAVGLAAAAPLAIPAAYTQLQPAGGCPDGQEQHTPHAQQQEGAVVPVTAEGQADDASPNRGSTDGSAQVVLHAGMKRAASPAPLDEPASNKKRTPPPSRGTSFRLADSSPLCFPMLAPEELSPDQQAPLPAVQAAVAAAGIPGAAGRMQPTKPGQPPLRPQSRASSQGSSRAAGAVDVVGPVCAIRRSPVKRATQDAPEAAQLDSLHISMGQSHHQLPASGTSGPHHAVFAHAEAEPQDVTSSELPAANLAAVHNPIREHLPSPPAAAPSNTGELATTSQLLCGNSSTVPPLPGDSQQQEGPECITGTERYEAWQRQQQQPPQGGELRQRSLTCPSRTGSFKDPSRSPSRTRLFSQTSSAGGVARSNRSYAELHRYARDTLSSASKKWSPPGSPAGAPGTSPGGSPRSLSLGAWRPPSSPAPHSPLQRSLTRATSKLGVGYAQQAAAREASQFARLSALNSTSTEASLAASRAAAWLAAGSNTPAGSPGRGSAELPSESTWHEGPQQPRLVPGSGLSAGGTSSAAGLGSRPGSGTGWPLGLRPGSSSAALSPVHSQDAQSVTVLVGGIHAVHRQRQLERAGSGSKGSGVVRRLSVSAAAEGEAVAAGADGATAGREGLVRTGTGLRASHMRHASVAPGIPLQQDKLGRTLLEANPKLQQIAAGSLMQIMQEGRMVHKSWVRPHLKQGGSTRLVRCTLGGGGKALLTYPHGLFKKPLQSSIKRVIIPTSSGWSPEQYIVVDTDKGMLRLQPSSEGQYALWVMGLNTVLNLGTESVARDQQEASTRSGAAGLAPPGDARVVGIGSFNSRRRTGSEGPEGSAAARGPGADSSMLLVGAMPWNESVLIG